MNPSCPSCGIELVDLTSDYVSIYTSELDYDSQPFEYTCFQCETELTVTMVPIPTFDVKVKNE